MTVSKTPAKSISLEEIDTMLNGGFDVFKHYYELIMHKAAPKPGVKAISPFRRANGSYESDPSFSVFFNRNKGKFFFKDSGIDKSGSYFQFVMDLFSLDFKGALARIKSDLLGMREGDLSPLVVPPRLYHADSIIKTTQTKLIPSFMDFSDSDLDFFKEAGISKSTLDVFRARRAASYVMERENKSFKIIGSDADPIYSFEVSSGRRKMYRPKSADPRFKWVSNMKADEDVFGLHLVPKECDVLVLIGGNRDTMSFFENIGLPVMALASETANISDDILAVIRRVAKKVISLYDLDAAGLRKAQRFQDDYGFMPANYIYGKFKGTNPDGTANDFVDFYKHNPGKCGEFLNYLLDLIENGSF